MNNFLCINKHWVKYAWQVGKECKRCRYNETRRIRTHNANIIKDLNRTPILSNLEAVFAVARHKLHKQIYPIPMVDVFLYIMNDCHVVAASSLESAKNFYLGRILKSDKQGQEAVENYYMGAAVLKDRQKPTVHHDFIIQLQYLCNNSQSFPYYLGHLDTSTEYLTNLGYQVE